PAGANGADWRDLLTGGPIIIAVTLGFLVVNALTVQADWPSLRSWAPWVWEGSSALALALVIWLPWLAAGAALTVTVVPAARRLARTGAFSGRTSGRRLPLQPAARRADGSDAAWRLRLAGRGL
ncbi:hypothetical protein, partial [Brevundimonas sp.]|uniref:hypothetical protein n=1 Tax=Brevundimonas sp. TaxID=1871086 RepID=UPI0028B052DE